MQQATVDAIEMIGALATPEAMWKRAASGVAPAARPKVNAHVHLPPNFSAFETVDQLLEQAMEEGIGVLGVSNYYDYTVYETFAAQARRLRIFPLLGLEIIALEDELVARGVKLNDPGNPGKLYICGKGITRFRQMTPRGQQILDLIRAKDSARMAALIDKLEEVFSARGLATGLTEDKVKERVVKRHGCDPATVYLQERHACQAFQEVFFEKTAVADRLELLAKILGAPTKAQPTEAVKIQNEIRSHLMKAGKDAYVEETFVNQSQAYNLILEMGGIPCYPTLADGASPISPFEQTPQVLIDNIKAMNVHMAEFIPLRNAPEVLEEYALPMRAAGLAVVAGTEHNTLDPLAIEPMCVDKRPIPDSVKQILWEGACVVAAHQFLVLNGQPGFVDRQGNPNPDYPDAPTRLEAFARLGAAVIQSYYES